MKIEIEVEALREMGNTLRRALDELETTINWLTDVGIMGEWEEPALYAQTLIRSVLGDYVEGWLEEAKEEEREAKRRLEAWRQWATG